MAESCSEHKAKRCSEQYQVSPEFFNTFMISLIFIQLCTHKVEGGKQNYVSTSQMGRESTEE